MPLDLKAFQGTLQYASELFGVYQPLIGWRARQAKKRVNRERAVYLKAALTRLVGDDRFRQAFERQATRGDFRPMGPDAPLQPTIAGLASGAVEEVGKVVAGFVAERGRPPEDAEWPAVLQAVDFTPMLRELAARDGNVRPSKNLLAVRETLTAGTLGYLATQQPHVLGSLFHDRDADWRNPEVFDPIRTFPARVLEAALSPIGVMELYRQYFFELRTFLGPAVGHVWVSPGGSLEVFEIETRKVLEERELEAAGETTTRSEREERLEDELATKVARENMQDARLGVSASGGASFGVYHAEASANYNLQTLRKAGEETAHKRNRQQSEKASEEIRRSFKTRFRTSLELQHTASRRHVLSNTTDKLVNHEFRRKMRQVGVQMQHIGTQLCWQTYLDRPGDELGVSELVHIARSDDLASAALQHPERPVLLNPQITQHWLTYSLGDSAIFEPPVPAPGYVLTKAEHTHPDIHPEHRFEVQSDRKSFRFFAPLSPSVTEYRAQFPLRLYWEQPDKKIIEDAYRAKLATFKEAERRLAQKEYVNAVRERVKLAGQVRRRPDEDLREEERTVVFRRLIRELTAVEEHTPHLTAELIRSIFDIERMLYFVAPEWWRANDVRPDRQVGGQSRLLGDATIGWGGVNEAGRRNYYVTEESAPAPLGASLGWLLQLDGDEHRNAFLNSPWVKATIPIRPGREREALEWLQKQGVEGADGLVTERGHDTELKREIVALADQIAELNGPVQNQLATETVFEKGFDPLAGGFRAPGNPEPGTPFKPFTQWVEILPTDQVVTLEYTPGASLG